MRRNGCRAYEDLITEALFGEMDDAGRQKLGDHLASCTSCAEAFREMQATLGTMAARRRPEPEAAFWDAFDDRLAARLRREEGRRDWRGRLVDWARVVRALVWPLPRWSYQLAMAVVLVAAGVWIGKVYYGRPGVATHVEQTGDPTRPPIREAALEARTRHYMERSKVLLLGLVNFDAASEDAAMLNLPRKQEIARDLLDQADGLKQDLDAAKAQRLRELVDDLEVTLLQIANLQAEVDVPAIELVRSGVDRRALLLKINVEEMRMSTDDTAPAKSTGGTGSSST